MKNGTVCRRLSATASSPQTLLQNFTTVRDNGIGAITLSGLPAGTPFTVVFYGTNGTFADGSRGTMFTLYKDASLKTAAGTATTSGTTDPGGNVFATYAGGVGNEGDFNGLQIQVGKP